ncbi:TetR family transcriptional regulator [Amycolatopsis antarctica]|uniref:TetR family transcriptional regulator n=1 Tax=Amycolatopsis antarctica TaxID=1854586 RepID=A0A263D8F2_9PSEU|nr:TetR/AcrR family transcriptional regulator [Amycolatopsis antarctica]OZM74723.1 TetR family transcriptional regulator [Amycolatopsis antarctica]
MPKIVDPAARRLAIADAVCRVIARSGIEHATLRVIAREAGLAIGSVRHYFADYEELLAFAMETYNARVGARLRAHLARLTDADPRAVVEDMLGELLPLDEQRRAESLVWLELTTAARKRPELRRHADRFAKDTRTLVARILTGSAERGKLRPGIDIAVETVRLTALIDGLVTNAVVHPARTPPDLARQVVRTHLDSLSSESGDSRPAGVHDRDTMRR